MKVNLVNYNINKNYLEELLTARGVKNTEEFISPTVSSLQPPTNLENVVEGARLLNEVVANSTNRILIVVDSDNDGFTSAAIIYQYIKRMNPDIEVDYCLHDGKQHGLEDHINWLMTSEKHYNLIILPDSSSNDKVYHDKLKEINTPCLVIDHHLTDEELSDNAIIINNQLSPNYSNKDLTGAGVVYQFCRQLDAMNGTNWADDYIDLAAWGIVGDMGSLMNLENRYIVYTGLAKPQNDFFKCLINKAAYSITGSASATWSQIIAKLTPTAVAFYVVPMVNALIRVGTSAEKERLFLAFIDGSRMVPCNKRGAKGTMERVDVEAAREATNAKAHQTKIKDQAVEKLEARIFKYDLLSNKVLFVRLDDTDKFPAELNGLIAMQLSAKYKKPTIVARLNDEGFIRGSARGVSNCDLTDFKQFLTDSHYFEYAQGHANAFGISIPNESLSDFHKYANEKLKDIDFGENVYNVDFIRSISSSDLIDLIAEIGSVPEMWGQGCPEPLIYIRDMYIQPSEIQVIGSNKDTLKWEKNGIVFIKFKAKALIEEMQSYQGEMKVEVVGRANLNEWMGRYTPQLLIEDCEIKKSSILDF